MLRIRQFDKNSNNHDYLACAGFEVYGDVYRQHTTINWDQRPRNKSEYLQIEKSTNCVIKSGPQDIWQTVKTQQPLNYDEITGQNEFCVLLEICEYSTNVWRFMIGIAPDEFTCDGREQWLGSQKSYAYIGGTGGKCYDEARSINYGLTWGMKAGDVVTVRSNIKTKQIEFILNGTSQGIAFDNFNPNGRDMFAAVSITATGSRVRLMEKVTPKSKPLIRNTSNQTVMNIPKQMTAILRENSGWDTNLKSENLSISPDTLTVINEADNDEWQCVLSQIIFNSGKYWFEINIINDSTTTNQWKYIVGVAPISFDPKRFKWLGSQKSWGYIGGTGGKCHIEGYSASYGEVYGVHDKIKCICDFDQKTIEFFKNDESQGIAFTNLSCHVRPAVSLTGKGAAVKICKVHHYG